MTRSPAVGSYGRKSRLDSEMLAPSPVARFPEDDVLVAAGEIAKESRSVSNGFDTFSDRRRRARSLTGSSQSNSALSSVGHASSEYSMREHVPPVPPPNSPTPSIHSFKSVSQVGTDPIHAELNRRTLLQAKRSLPLLLNVWENFLEEASEDAESLDEPEPAQETLFTTVNYNPRLSNTSASRSRHTPSPSNSSVLTTSNNSVHSRKLSQVSSVDSPTDQRSSRLYGHKRSSYQPTNSTSSNSGSTSSMAAFSSFSSVSSVTTALTSESSHMQNESPRNRDDPLFVGQSGEMVTPASARLSVLRGCSPSSSSSSSCSSQSLTPSTTPTPTTAGLPMTPLTPSVSRSSSRSSSIRNNSSSSIHLSPAQNNRLSTLSQNAISSARRSPLGGHYYDQTLELSHTMDCKKPGRDRQISNASKSPRQVVSKKSSSEARLIAPQEEEDVLSELGYYTTPSHQRSPLSALAPLLESRELVRPPPRRSSRQNLAHYSASLPRSKSTSNMKIAEIERPQMKSTNPPPAVSSGISGASTKPLLPLHPQYHREYVSADYGSPLKPPPSTVGRMRAGSASAGSCTRPAGSLNVDVKSLSRKASVGQVQGRSPLTPSSSNTHVQWGYAL